MKKQRYLAKKILHSNILVEDHILTVNEFGVIESISPRNKYDLGFNDLGDVTLYPGLIDTHVHGAKGHDVMDATHDSLNTMSTFFSENGVTAFLATTVTAPPKKIETALKQIGDSFKVGLDGAELLGGYLEGPYFTEKNRGAHPTEWFRDLTISELAKWNKLSDYTLKKVALAPEKDNVEEIIRFLKNNDIKVMLGHSDACVDTVEKAFDAGADGIVHCYNGMRGLHHRDPGLVGSGLCRPNSYVEIIADGNHVHPIAIDVAHRCCGDRLTLITDAMEAAGMPDGQYQLGEYLVNVTNGVVMTNSGGLAGSTLRLIDAVFNISQWLNIPLEQAWLRGSLTPARSLDMDDVLGTLDVGKAASMVSISPKGEVKETWVNGNKVYSNVNSNI